MPGRNDQCPCGSGKKYKRCCLSKDQDATDAKIKAESAIVADEPTNITPHQVENEITWERRPKQAAEPARTLIDIAIESRWNQFENADDQGKRALFIQTLDLPELMDDEMAYEMLSAIYHSGIESQNWTDWEDLVVRLQERLPEVYAQSRKFYLGWRIASAIATDRRERIPELACQMAETAGDDVDIYSHVVDRLAYHGELNALSQASHVAWPLIESSTNIMWGQEDFAEWGAQCVLFERLESRGNLNAHEQQLMDPLHYYFEDLDLDRVQERVDIMSGRVQRVWSLDDLDLSRNGSRNKKHKGKQGQVEPGSPSPAKRIGKDALWDLSLEFIEFARHHEGIPYTKIELARSGIASYLVKRHAGKFKQSHAPSEALSNRQKKLQSRFDTKVHPLCPDRDTLNHYFGDQMSMFSIRVHLVAATFELLPTWLRFLESRGLIDADQRESTLAELSSLQSDLLKLYENDRTDPVLTENIRQWREIAATPVSMMIEAKAS